MSKGTTAIRIFENCWISTAALKHPGIDIVSICTPQHVHCQRVLAVEFESKSF